ncbi:UDP-N-acetylmuramoyl-L-alanyl-D-glutamate--2,6-diaminopimelate ligase [Halovulum sp. GXIMD14793]
MVGAKRAGDWSGGIGAVTGLAVDSREVKPGYLFFAVPGTTIHGGEFVTYAQRMGAVAVITDAEGLAFAEKDGATSLPILVHANPRLALAQAAARWFGAQPEVMTAVTGTNGKTSVASFTRQIWEELGACAVNFGTTGVEGALSAPLSHTTPEPIKLHRLLADLAKEKVSHAAMEASSHGLAQCRLDGVRLRAAAFTNISRDHLDYHADFEDYFQAKAGLFTRVLGKDGIAVLNLDDQYGQKLRDICLERGQEVIGVGHDDGALRILNSRFDTTGQDLRFSWNDQVHMARLDLIGGFQAQNALVAAGLAIATGFEPQDVFRALGTLTTVRGRMQRAAVRANGAAIYVDYSHTPDALATALQSLRPHVMGRLLVVFGAGGDRDKGKRPLMGQAAKAHADVVYVTDDNPRSEDPATIRTEIMAAAPGANEIGDRAEAILAATDALQPGDTLLIAGKGHETGQIIGDDILPFDDAEAASVAVAALEGLGS